MVVEVLPVGVFQCNCVIVACEATRKAVLIDPGDEPDRILDVVRAHGLDVVLAVHTHAHIDHIMGTASIVERTGAEARLHAYDRVLWNRMDLAAATFGIPTPTVPPLGAALHDGETLTFGREYMRVIHTPGHTPGSCCFTLTPEPARHLVVSGDTLFRGSIGIVDIQKRRTMSAVDAGRVIRSIRTRLLTLSDDTRVIPGHGPDTHIGTERHSNPFLQAPIEADH